MKYGLLVVAVLVLVWIAKPLPWTVSPTGGHLPGSDAGFYYQAALDLRHGKSPYGAAVAWAQTHTATDPSNIAMDVYTYTPLLALLLLPFTFLPVSLFAAGWVLLLVLSAGYLAHYLTRLVNPTVRVLDQAIAVMVALDVVLLFGPLRHSMRGAQVDILLIALVVFAWNAARKHSWVLSSVVLGLVIAIKPTYGILLGFHLWRRDWRGIGVTLATACLSIIAPFLLVPHQALTDFLRVSAFWAAPGFLMAPKSISLFGVFERACFTASPVWPLCSAPIVSRATMLVVVIGCFAAASVLVPLRFDHVDATRWHYAFGLIVLVDMLGSPLTEDAHLALALIPLGVIVAALRDDARRGQRTAWLALLMTTGIFIYWTLPIRSLATFSSYGGWRALLAGYWFYGLAALAAGYAWLGWQTTPLAVERSVLAHYWAAIVANIGRLVRRGPANGSVAEHNQSGGLSRASQLEQP
jgi:hypothetical protein